MKTRNIFIAFLFMTSIVWAGQAQELPRKSNSVWPFSQVGLGCFYGISASRVIGEGLCETYFAPTSGKQMVIGQPFGIEIEGEFLNYFGVATGFRWNHFGQNTKQRQVMFRDDIFIHDFQATAEISYFSIPLVLKGGITREKFWAFIRAGGIGQLTVTENLVWQIDGKNAIPGSPRMPEIIVKPATSSYLIGGETGIKVGRNGFFLLGDLYWGSKSFAYGLPGTAVMQAAEFFVGYRRFFN